MEFFSAQEIRQALFVLAKYAYYSADNAYTKTDASFANTDTQKIWLQGNVNF